MPLLSCEYNTIVPLKNRIPDRYFDILNKQKNKMKSEAKYDSNGDIIQPYVFIIGAGEKHANSFKKVIAQLSNKYPWIKKQNIDLIIYKLLLSSQQDVIESVIKKISHKKKAIGCFYLILYLNREYCSILIEIIDGSFNDLERLERNYINCYSSNGFPHDRAGLYDKRTEEVVTGLNIDSNDKYKYILTKNNKLVLCKSCNNKCYNENISINNCKLTLSSIYKNGVYLWKRVFVRISNNSKTTGD